MNQLKLDEFRFNMDSIKEKLEELGAKKVLIQVPDGLRRHVGKIIDELEDMGIDISIWGGTCFGACDLPIDIGDADVLLHIGHSEIPNLESDYPVIFVEGRSGRWNGIPEELFEKITQKVALYASVQYLDHLDKVREDLEEKGYEIFIGEGDGRIKYPGQVLGCNYSVRVPEANSHVYIGTGKFHPVGLSLSLQKEVIIFNPITRKISSTKKEMDRIIRKRFASITNAEKSKRIGIILSQKKGQRRENIAKKLKNLSDDKSIIIEFDEIEPDLVDDFQFDCFVNTACPRIALDDSLKFKTRMLTPVELLILFKNKEWDEWEMDEIH